MQLSKVFYRRYGKRLLDVCCSAVGLIVLTPLLLTVALVVKWESKGHALFGQCRVGKEGKIFTIWKFRTMIPGADKVGPLITAAGDPRVTLVGKFLRRWKLDELPQLWNVLVGDMSLVGPRPELPLYVRDYTPGQLHVFSVCPGVTDPAALEYRNEEDILAGATDRERLYKEVILPRKLALSLDYIKALSFPHDVAILLRTFKVISGKQMLTTATNAPNSPPNVRAGT